MTSVPVLCVTILFAAVAGAARLGPPIFQYDDLEDCLTRDSTYCYTKTLLEDPKGPNAKESPKSLKLSVEFRKDLLQWGLCTRECAEEVEKLSDEKRASLTRPKKHFKYEISHDYFPEMQFMDYSFGDMIHVCINGRLSEMYNMSGLINMEYCYSRRYIPWKPFDWLEFYFFVLLFTTLVGITISNVLELFGPPIFRSIPLVKSLSIRKNFHRLTSWSTEESLPEIRCMNGIRFLLTIAFIGFNCFFQSVGYPVDPNPQDAESYLKLPLMINLLSYFFWIVPVWLTFDGYRMMSHFLMYIEWKPEPNGRYFVKMFLFKLLELAPLYTMCVLYSTVMDSLWDSHSSLAGYIAITKESRFCRRNFWLNLLFVNNYPIREELCFEHGWYFAAAIQLLFGAYLLLWIMWNIPALIKPLKWIFPTAAFLLPGIYVLLYDLEPVPPLGLTDIGNNFMYQDWYRTMFIPGHMNAGSYIAGMFAAYHVHMTTVREVNLSNNKLYIWVKHLSLPLILAVAFTPYLFYTHELLQHRIFSAVYAVFFRSACIAYVVACLCQGFRNIPRFLRCLIGSRFYIIPAKLSYSMLVIHFLVMRAFAALWDPREYFELIKFPILYFCVFSITFSLAVLTYLIVEQPVRDFFTGLLYIKLPRRSRRRRQDPSIELRSMAPPEYEL